MRGTAWVNTFQTVLFLLFGAVAILVVARGVGGFSSGMEALLADPRLRKLSFTGSTEVGQVLLKGAADGVLRTYPGSPWLALQCLRPQDRLRLFELHGNESALLATNLRREPKGQVIITAGDGLAGLKSILPTASRRALSLIDPSYEVKEDYAAVVESLRDGLKRFATGSFALWYPLLSRRDSQELPARLKAMTEEFPGLSWLNVSLNVRQPTRDGVGMFGSGMFLINPPWTLATELKTVMPWLTMALGEEGAGRDQASFVLQFAQK